MEKKEIIYQITRKKFEKVKVETEEQEELIKELNRDSVKRILLESYDERVK